MWTFRTDCLEIDVFRLLDTASVLLTLLTNPSNISLLTSHLLSAPVIWAQPNGLRSVVHVLNLFSSAAARVNDQQNHALSSSFPYRSISGTLDRELWATATVKGANSKSPRWRHLCVLVGLQIGFAVKSEMSLSYSLRRELQSATVKAANLALGEMDSSDVLAADSISLLISYVFDTLNDMDKLAINFDHLLPVLYRGPLMSREGLYWGYFLSTIDAEVIQISDSTFEWSASSSTHAQCQRMATGPFISALGPLSRLLAFATEHTHNVELIHGMVQEIATFSKSLCTQWRQNKFSEIDTSEESAFLTEETLKESLPTIWRILRSGLFAIVVALRSILGRVLHDPRLSVAGSKCA